MRLDLHNPWTEQDDARLVELYDVQKLGPTEIAQAMRRSVNSVSARLGRFRKQGKIRGSCERCGRPHPGAAR